MTDLRKPNRSEGHENLQRKPGEATEDYLEAIDSLVDGKGFAPSVDIAERLKVSKPTVTNMVKKLDREGFPDSREISRNKTDRERKEARGGDSEPSPIYHALFLMLFGVGDSVAGARLQRIEHGMHPDNLDKLGAFT